MSVPLDIAGNPVSFGEHTVHDKFCYKSSLHLHISEEESDNGERTLLIRGEGECTSQLQGLPRNPSGFQENRGGVSGPYPFNFEVRVSLTSQEQRVRDLFSDVSLCLEAFESREENGKRKIQWRDGVSKEVNLSPLLLKKGDTPISRPYCFRGAGSLVPSFIEETGVPRGMGSAKISVGKENTTIEVEGAKMTLQVNGRILQFTVQGDGCLTAKKSIR